MVVVNYNCREHIGRTLESLRHQTVPDVEAIVLDNGSSDGSVDLVSRRFPEVRQITSSANLGFAAGNNHAVARATGEFVMLLNPDAWLEPDSLERLAATLSEDPQIGVVGGTVRHPDGTIQEQGNRVDRFCFPLPRRGDATGPIDRECFYVGGCSLMMRLRDWRLLGGLDERMFMFFEEVDLCWRAQRSGFDVAVVPDAVIWHVGGATLSGGYAREGGRHATSPTRIYLRERNTLASVIRNGDPATIGFAALGWILNAVEAVGFLALRQPRVAAQYPRALAWNLWRLPETLRMRRALRRTFVRGDRDINGWARGSGKLEVLRAGGVPTVEKAGG